MNAKITVASVVFVSLQFAGFSAGCAYYESAMDLENQCNETVTISCPTQYSGKAGTVRFAFWNLPPSDCTVNVTLEASCGSTYAIYFNIRKFILRYTDGVRIYEDEWLIRALDGLLSASYDPASVAQVRTRCTRRPAVRTDYIRGPSIDTAATETFFDYIVVEGQSTCRDTYCGAFSEYVTDEYICDKDVSTDHCNCPSNHSPISYGQNPAYARQYCRSSSGSSSYMLSPGAIIGIIFSVFSFLLAMIRAIAYANKHNISPSSPQVMPSSLVLITVTVSQPAVVVQPVFPSSEAPPSYDQVMGPGGATTYPAAPVQKF